MLKFLFREKADINSKMEEARRTEGAVILDVRGSDEYRQGHIPGAINVPVDSIEGVSAKIPDKSTPVFSYCLSGARSARAVKAMKAMGYTNVINTGGISAYKGDIER